MIYQFDWPKIEKCDDCPLLDWEQACFCQLTEKPVRANLGVAALRPEWCPLKESVYGVDCSNGKDLTVKARGYKKNDVVRVTDVKVYKREGE